MEAQRLCGRDAGNVAFASPSTRFESCQPPVNEPFPLVNCTGASVDNNRRERCDPSNWPSVNKRGGCAAAQPRQLRPQRICIAECFPSDTLQRRHMTEASSNFPRTSCSFMCQRRFVLVSEDNEEQRKCENEGTESKKNGGRAGSVSHPGCCFCGAFMGPGGQKRTQAIHLRRHLNATHTRLPETV